MARAGQKKKYIYQWWFAVQRFFSLKDGVKHKKYSIFLTLTLYQNTVVFKFTWISNDSSWKMGFHDEYASNMFILTLNKNSAFNDFSLIFES